MVFLSPLTFFWAFSLPTWANTETLLSAGFLWYNPAAFTAFFIKNRLKVDVQLEIQFEFDRVAVFCDLERPHHGT
jgi:hypothetical protein